MSTQPGTNPPTESAAMSKVCSFTPCGRTASEHGLCPSHASQLRRRGSLKPIVDRGGPCTFPGCVKPLKGRGYCVAHYAQERRGVTLHPLQAQTGGVAAQHLLCTFPGCTGPRKSQGYCGAHYSQWRRGVELRPIGQREPRAPRKPKLNRPAICTFEGCSQKHSALGLCKAHWVQQRTGNGMRPIGEWRQKHAAGVTPRPKLTPKPRKVSDMPANWDKPLPLPRKYGGSDKSAVKGLGTVIPMTSEEVRAMRRILQLLQQDDLAGAFGISLVAA